MYYRAHYTILLFIIFLLGFNPLSAQFTAGIKTNYFLSFSKPSQIKYDDAHDFLTYELSFIEEDISPGYGLFISFQEDLFLLKLELAYRKTAQRFRYVNYQVYDDLRPKTTISETHSLVIPLLSGFSFQELQVSGGPVFDFVVGRNISFQDIEDLEQRHRDLRTGLCINMSYSIAQLQVELIYEKRFHGVGEQLYYRGEQKAFQASTSYIGIGLAYLISFN